MFQDINNVVLSGGDFLGSARDVPLSSFSSCDLTMTYCVDFPLFPPGSTQVFDINLLLDLPSVSSGSSLDFFLTPVFFLLVFGYLRLLGYPGAVLA